MRLIKIPDKTHFIDDVMVLGGVVGPLSALPQIINIYSNQDAGQVSLLSWAFFTILSFVGIIYSIIHKEKIILLGYSLYFIVDFFIVLGILIYR